MAPLRGHQPLSIGYMPPGPGVLLVTLPSGFPARPSPSSLKTAVAPLRDICRRRVGSDEMLNQVSRDKRAHIGMIEDYPDRCIQPGVRVMFPITVLRLICSIQVPSLLPRLVSFEYKVITSSRFRIIYE